ncbi:MAG TPA: PIG-L deacetylase family protein [Acidimicrobiia bacterium]|nr:PIG-L deacetylase family protein [Acidimicrobiia bacterium]
MSRRSSNLFSEAASDPTELAVPSRALSIAAHPDDAEFGAGGTLAKWADAGCEVTLLIATDGSKGTWDPEQAPEDLAAARRAEAVAAAQVLGASPDVIFLDHVDGELHHSPVLQEELCLWIRRLRPEVVLSWDPWKRYMLHPDHREIGWGTCDAVVAARDHLFFPHQLFDGLTKHRPDALLLYAADQPDHYEDVSSTFGRKIEALLCHSSQSQTTMQDAATAEEGRAMFEERIADWCRRMGEPAGLPLAESFKLIRP